MNMLSDESDFLERIDAVCARFARELRSTAAGNSAISIEALLSQHSDLPRQELLRELLREELEYLQKRGQHPSADDLQRRFPHDSDVIADVLSPAQVGAGVAADDRTLPADPGQLADSGPVMTRHAGSRDEWKPQIKGFQLYEQLGKGGMGVVYRAVDHHRRQVALKVLPPERLSDKRAQERFDNEIYALGRLRHQNIVQVHESGQRDGVYFYSMDYIRGQNLAALIRAASDQITARKAGAAAVTPPVASLSTQQQNTSHSGQRADGGSGSTPQPPEGAIIYPSSDFLQTFLGRRSSSENRRATDAVVQIGIDVAEALHYAHGAGVTHRDLKPANLLLDVTGRVWVADFGLAQVDDGAALTMEGEVLGTWRYMSPEQLMGGRVIVDSLTDIYSLGVTLYELLCLQPARDGKDRHEVRNQVAFGDPIPLRQRNPAIPRDLETIIHRAIAYRPKDRYQTMQEFAADLRRFQRREPIHAKPAGLLKRFSLWVEREQKLAASLAASAALLLVILGLLLAFVNSGRIHAKQAAAQESAAKNTAQQQAREAEAGRLVAWSHERREHDPTLSMLLGLESYSTLPTVEALTATLMSLHKSHELRTWQPRKPTALESKIVVSPSGRAIVLANHLQDDPGLRPAIESDTTTGITTNSFGTDPAVIHADYSPDGNWLLTLEITADPSPLATLRVGPTSNSTIRTALHTVPLSDLPLRNGVPFAPAAFLSNSTQLLISDNTNSIKLYNLQRLNQQLHPESLRLSTPFSSITTNDSDGTFAATTMDGRLLLFSTATKVLSWEVRLPFTTTKEAPCEIAHHDSNLIITTSTDGLHFFSTTNGALKHAIPTASRIATAARANLAVTFGRSYDCGLLDLSSLKTVRRLKVDEPVINAAVSATGNFIALAGVKSVQVLTRGGQPAVSIPLSVNDLLFLPDESLLSLQPAGMLSRWSMTSLASQFACSNSDEVTHSKGICINPEATHLFYAANPTSLTHVHALKTGRHTVIPGTSGRAFAFDHTFFTAEGRVLNQWDIENGILRRARSWRATEPISLIQQTQRYHAFAVTTDGQLLSADGSQPGETLESIIPHTVSDIRFAKSAGLTAVGTHEGYLYCADHDATYPSRVTAHDRPITTVSVDPTSKTIAAADDRGAFAIWKINDPNAFTTIRNWADSPLTKITSLHFRAQDNQLFLAGDGPSPMAACFQLSDGTIDSSIIDADILHSAVSPIAGGLYIATDSGLRHWLPGQAPTQISKSPVFRVACTNSEVVTVESDSAPPLDKLKPSLIPPSRLTASTLLHRAIDKPSIPIRSEPLEHLVRRMEYDNDSDTLCLDCQSFPASMCSVDTPQKTIFSVSHPSPLCYLALKSTQPKLVSLTRTGLLTYTNTNTQMVSRTRICTDTVATANASRNGELLVLWTVSGERVVYNCSENRMISSQKYKQFPMHQSEINNDSTWLELSSDGSLSLCEIGKGELNIRDIGVFSGAIRAEFVSPDDHIGVVHQSNQSNGVTIVDPDGTTLMTHDTGKRSVSFLQAALGMILLSDQSGSELVRIHPEWSVVDSIPQKSAITHPRSASLLAPEIVPLISPTGVTLWNSRLHVAEAQFPVQAGELDPANLEVPVASMCLSATGRYLIWRDTSFFCMPRDIATTVANIVARDFSENERTQFKIKSRRDRK
ncbi:MAG: protein kinase domain-containing protein [Planctomyces sp.]